MVESLQSPYQERVQSDGIGTPGTVLRTDFDAVSRCLLRHPAETGPSLPVDGQHPFRQTLDQFVQFRSRLGPHDANPAQRFPTPIPTRMRLQGNGKPISQSLTPLKTDHDAHSVHSNQVMECHWWGKCPSTTQACTWDTAFDWNDCQSMHAICTRGNGGTGTCRWSHSRSYRQCSAKRAGVMGGEPKNPDNPARPSASAGSTSISATSSSRRWKNNLLLRS